MNRHLIIIDGQNDFCFLRKLPVITDTITENHARLLRELPEKGALYVDGADQDMERLARMIREHGSEINAITATMDSHHLIHIAHPMAWVDRNGNHPPVYTVITFKDFQDDIWKASNPSWQYYFYQYVRQLEHNGRYNLCIWPPHCIIGTWGHNFHPVLAAALYDWEEKQRKVVNIVMKGMNWKTEQYSIFRADVPDSNDPLTQMNMALLNYHASADEILITGEALSHCVANSVEDLISFNSFNPHYAEKLVLLTDTCSSVGGLEHLGKQFVQNATGRGMRRSTTVEYFK